MEILYSKKQKIIVETISGSMAVVASAGSGKTRVLTGRIAYILSNNQGSNRILALTFTNKAADEMKSRLKSIPNITDKVFIGTIHSFCLNIVQEKGHIIGYNEMPHIFSNETDRLEIVIDVIQNNKILSKYYNEKNETNQKRLAYEALDYISTRKRNLDYNIAHVEDELEILYQDYNTFLKEQNAIDYDDIILLAYRILSERPKIGEIYSKLYAHICVDEAQDLNYAQYEFIKLFCLNSYKSILMVGDDKQAIFGFNGSDKKYFAENFIKDFNSTLIELNENYRCSKAVINIANTIYPGSNDESIAVIPGLVKFYSAEDENDEAQYVFNKIDYYLNELQNHNDIEGDITNESICIIARNKYLFNEIEEKLKNDNIPYYYKRGNDTILFETDKLKIFELGLRIILNPMDKLHLKQLYKLLDKSEFDNDISFDQLKKIIIEYNDVVLKSIVDSWGILLKNEKNYRLALGNIQQKLEESDLENEEKLSIYNEINLAKEYWKKYCSSVSNNSISIQGFLNNVALGMINLTNYKENGIALATVHSSKGLEFDIVFIIGLNEGSFPDYRAIKTGGKALEEEKNETYVAITRAKRFLHLTYPQYKFMPWDNETPYSQKVSRFLDLKWSDDT